MFWLGEVIPREQPIDRECSLRKGKEKYWDNGAPWQRRVSRTAMRAFGDA